MQFRNRLLARTGITRTMLLLLSVITLIGMTFPLGSIRAAQAEPIILQLAVSNFQEDAINDAVLQEFYARVPGVKVQLVRADNGFADPAQAGLTTYFESVSKYVASADVLNVDESAISPSATQAGYYLDMSPLIAEDTSLAQDDFFPAAWQSYQWDKGTWALPYAISPLVFTYDPKAFDDAGMAYPSEQWTLTDLVDAARKLTQKDAQGKVTVSGFNSFSPQASSALFRSLLNQDLFDSSNVPYTPQIIKPEVEALMTAWNDLDNDGGIGSDLNNGPMAISPAVLLVLPSTDNANAVKRVGMLLPGGKAGLNVDGFAISAGTQHPKEAYELAKFLTERAELTTRFNSTPARRSLLGKDDGSGGFRLNIPKEVEDLILNGVENALAVSELRFVNYLAVALTKVKTGTDVATALQEAEQQAITDQQTAVDKKSTVTVSINPPATELVAADGRLTIKFGFGSFIRGNRLPNQEAWDQFIKDFVANDPQVGAIDFKVGFDQFEQAVQKYDCFYTPFNNVPNAALEKILALDPFLDADSTFDRSDVIGNVLSQVTRDQKIWGFPMIIEPSIMKYDPQKFDKAGAVAPQAGWTIDEFNNAVRALKINKEDPAPFQDTSNSGGVHLLIMMAAYGGLPLDYRTDPPTINYSDPKTVTAMKQVLDLAKDGYIKYEKLASFFGGPRLFGGPSEDAVIKTDALNGLGFRRAFNNTNTQQTDAYLPTTYPRGTEFTGASFSIGVGHITATTQVPEGCYRFLTAISRNMKLFNTAMPSRRSLTSDPAVTAGASPELVALYGEFDTLLSDPTTIIFPSQFGGGASPTGFLLQYWLYGAFDKYVLEDKELEPALADAENFSKEFQACAATLPPLDATTQETAREYIKAFGKCATQVDPSLAPIFNLIQ